MMKLTFGLLCMIFLFSCSKKENKKIVEIEYYSEPDTIQLQKNITEKGDIESFLTLMRIYETPEDTLTSKILKYSFIMADKYNYSKANYLIDRSIIRKEMHTNNYIEIKNLDEKNKIIVLERLNKCSNQNTIVCTEVLIDYNKSIDNISEVKKLEEKLDSLIN